MPDYGARLYICGKVNRIMDSGKERAEAFEKVFREWYPRLCAYAATIVRDGEEARDIVSQVFLRLWEKERNLEWGPGVRPYLFQCVYNAALNFIRAEKVRCRFFEFLRRDMEEGEEPGDEERERLLERVEELIGQMPEQTRAVFLLNRFEGKTCAEIAAATGVSVRTVENQVYRAMTFLRERLGGSLRDELVLLFLAGARG